MNIRKSVKTKSVKTYLTKEKNRITFALFNLTTKIAHFYHFEQKCIFLFSFIIKNLSNIDTFVYFLVKVDYQLIFGTRYRTASKLVTEIK